MGNCCRQYDIHWPAAVGMGYCTKLSWIMMLWSRFMLDLHPYPYRPPGLQRSFPSCSSSRIWNRCWAGMTSVSPENVAGTGHQLFPVVKERLNGCGAVNHAIHAGRGGALGSRDKTGPLRVVVSICLAASGNFSITDAWCVEYIYRFFISISRRSSGAGQAG